MIWWAEDLLHEIDRGQSGEVLLSKIQIAAQALGFDYCAFGMRLPVPISSPKTLMLNTYPASWQERYAERRYLEIDPSVARGASSSEAFVWNDALFESSPELWEEARAAGLKVGWAKSVLELVSAGGMLSLARSSQALSEKELAARQPQMAWLAQTAHYGFRRTLAAQWNIKLSTREKEVLRWTADGKTIEEIATILQISMATVKFHTRSASEKLGTFNRTAAVARALAMGLLL